LGVGAFSGNDEVQKDKGVGEMVGVADVQSTKKQLLKRDRTPGDSLQVTVLTRDMTNEG